MSSSNRTSILQLLFPSTRVCGHILCQRGILALHRLFHDIRLYPEWILLYRLGRIHGFANTILDRQTCYRNRKTHGVLIRRSHLAGRLPQRPRLGHLRRRWLGGGPLGRCSDHDGRQRRRPDILGSYPAGTLPFGFFQHGHSDGPAVSAFGASVGRSEREC